MVNFIGRFVRDEEGQDLVEYAMLLAFIALIAIAGVRTLGTTVNTFFSNVATALTSGGGGS
jgi:pilus assembly protein Flp/PilA